MAPLTCGGGEEKLSAAGSRRRRRHRNDGLSQQGGGDRERNRGGGALSLLRTDGPLATCNSGRQARQDASPNHFLPPLPPPPPTTTACFPLLHPPAWLNGTFEGSESVELCLITLLQTKGEVCLLGRGMCLCVWLTQGVKRDLSCAGGGGA